MLYRTPDPQYERWRRERGTAYAEQQLRLKAQWERQQRSAATLRDLKADRQYNAQLDRLLDGLDRDTQRLLAFGRQSDAARKAQALRDLEDDERQYRLEQAQFKAIQQARAQPDAIEGLFTVHGVVSACGTRTHPGCFKGVNYRNVEYLHQHDRQYGNVARIKALWEITRDELPAYVRAAYPEATGGAVIVRAYLDTENGRAARQWVTGGHLKHMSYEFTPHRTTTRTLADGRTVRDLYEVDLVEVSDIHEGAVPGTMAISGTKRMSILEGRYRRV